MVLFIDWHISGNKATRDVFDGFNRKPLERDRRGQHSIRINDQFRICFVWLNGNAEDVEITDYHD